MSLQNINEIKVVAKAKEKFASEYLLESNYKIIHIIFNVIYRS